MQFVYGPLAPDAQETAAGILTVADGVLPLVEGYGPSPALTPTMSATALPGEPRGIISMFQRNGTNVVYGFTSTAFYQLNATYGWDLIASGLSLPASDDWSLAQFGNKLLASNTDYGMFEYDIELGGAIAAVPEAGAPREIFVCANYVVCLDCEDDAGNRDNRLIRTSVLGNHRDYTGSGADYQQLEDGGRLIGGIDLKNNAALIFQDNAIRAMQFGGSAQGAFSLLKVSDGRGSVGRRSITGLDGVAYWLSTDGFNSYSGGSIQHIGAGQIDRWFLGRVEISNLTKVQAALDPVNKIVLWRYPSLTNPSEIVFNDCIGYSWQFSRWFTRTGMISYLTQIATPGITLDAMGTSYGLLDEINILLDSRFFQGGQPVFAGLDETYRYATFSGDALEATFETGTSNAPVVGIMTRITPIDNAPGGTLSVGVKDQLSDDIEWKDGSGKTRAGYVNTRARGLNMAIRRVIPAGQDWTYAKGADHAAATPSGRRG